MRHLKAEKERKSKLRFDLETQMQAKVFKKEKERLYIDEKSLVTSKGMLKGVGATFLDQKVAEEATDLSLLKKENEFVDAEVRALQEIANIVWAVIASFMYQIELQAPYLNTKFILICYMFEELL